MNVLLDTHILLWSLSEDERLSDRAKEIILEPANSLYYSVVSVWEIAIKHALRPDNVKICGKEFSGYCQQAGFLSLDLRDKRIFYAVTVTPYSTSWLCPIAVRFSRLYFAVRMGFIFLKMNYILARTVFRLSLTRKRTGP